MRIKNGTQLTFRVTLRDLKSAKAWEASRVVRTSLYLEGNMDGSPRATNSPLQEKFPKKKLSPSKLQSHSTTARLSPLEDSEEKKKIKISSTSSVRWIITSICSIPRSKDGPSPQPNSSDLRTLDLLKLCD